MTMTVTSGRKKKKKKEEEKEGRIWYFTHIQS